MRFALLLILLCTVFCCAATSHADTFGPALLRDHDQLDDNATRSIILPYMFKSDSVGLAVGIGGGITGFQEGQMSVSGTAYIANKKAVAAYGLVSNVKVGQIDRLFFDGLISLGSYPDLWVFSGGGNAGSNDSSVNQRLKGRGHDNWFDTSFKYVLPWGGAKGKAISTYVLKDGLIDSGATGGSEWNPLESGVTFLEFKPFLRDQTVTDDVFGKQVFETAGVRAAFRHDNTDFPMNPTTGSIQKFTVSQGLDVLPHSDTWTSLEFQASKFISLGASDNARQRVIGLNFWTAGVTSEDLPPPYEGATLGNTNRMRGFDDNRFNDRAVVYYSAEYRYMPKWNPFEDVEYVKVDWVQGTAFAELARVAHKWDPATMHTDMKYDVGFRLSAMINKYLGRADFAFSDETWRIKVMFNHPF